MTCAATPCRCEERASVYSGRIYHPTGHARVICPTCGWCELVRACEAPSGGGGLTCRICSKPLRDENAKPCGACDRCWAVTPDVRLVSSLYRRDPYQCTKCLPLEWWERLPLLDGGPPLPPGEDVSPRVSALFDELERLRASQREDPC